MNGWAGRASRRGAGRGFFRAIGICLLAAVSVRAAGPSVPVGFPISEGGQPHELVIALDELAEHAGGLKYRVEAVAAAASPGSVQALAVAPAEAALVLYDAAAARTPAARRLLGTRLLVTAGPAFDVAAAARDVGGRLATTPAYAPNLHVLELPGPAAVLDAIPVLRARAGVLAADPILMRHRAKRFTPDDPLFPNQWHLRNTGQNGGLAGTDVNVSDVWDEYRGNGVTIGIIDDGLQVTHPDLSPNVDTNIDYDWVDGDSDPSPGVGDDHGTSCAGVSAARGNNGRGVTGAAFEATLVGLRLLSYYTSDQDEATAMAYQNAAIDIKSNSWGPSDTGTLLAGPGALTIAALKAAVLGGRGGRGTIFTWAGGNGGQYDDQANKDGYANSIYTISVAACNDLGERSYYSEEGACHVVAAPSNGGNQGITTTDILGGYTSSFGGTSSACPLVAGVIALMLEANPELGWRDVQEILMRTAVKIDSSDSGWVENAAGLHFNALYGAGMVNAASAVSLAKSWSNLDAQLSVTNTYAGGDQPIPDGEANGHSFLFDLSGENDLRVEHVTLTATITHSYRGNLKLVLTSPAGTPSVLVNQHSDPGDNYTAWTFMTVRNWGESSAGTWELKVIDNVAGNQGTVKALTLTVYGTSSGPPATVPVITSPTNATGNVGDAFLYRITASQSPTAFGAAGLPAGLSVDAETGRITGTPTLVGTNVVMLTASNVVGVGTGQVSLAIGPRILRPPVITGSTNDIALIGIPYSYQIVATRNPTNYAAANRPAWLGFDPSSGLLSGTPDAVGTNVIVLTAANADGIGTNTLTLRVYTLEDYPLNDAVDVGLVVMTTDGTNGWFRQTAVSSDGADAAQSGPAGANGESSLATRLDGPAVLTFDWRVSSETNFDVLTFYVDEAEQAAISGEQGWLPLSVHLDAGSHALRWSYTKDFIGDGGADAGWVDRLRISPDTTTLAEALDTGAYTWTTSGTTARSTWFGQPHVGHDDADAAAAGAVADNESSTLQTIIIGPGTLSFYWKVSSELDYDFLSFEAVGHTNLNAAISGNLDWVWHGVELPSGTVTCRWTYAKDEFFSDGSDAAWLDQVSFVPLAENHAYTSWGTLYFSDEQLADPLVSGPLADPDGDGFDNLFEYAMNTNPLIPGTDARPGLRADGGYFVYEFRKDTAKTDIDYTLEAAETLLPPVWTPATSVVTETVGSVELREHSHALQPHRFLRLRITQTTP